MAIDYTKFSDADLKAIVANDISSLSTEALRLIAGQEAPPAPALSTERTWGEAIKDVPASLLTGAGSLLQAPGQLVKLVPGLKGVGEALEAPGEAVQKYGTDLKSTGLKAREALRSQAMSDAEKDGVLSEFATAITSTLKDPALITSFITEQVPMLLGPLGAARLTTKLGMGAVEGATAGAAREAAAAQLGQRATTAAVGTGTAMQAADVSGDTYTNTLKRALEMGMSQQEAEDAALNAARIAAGGAAAVSLGANLGLSKLGGAAIERRLAGLPGRGRIQSGLGEATSETLEEAGGQLFQNIGVRTVDPSQSLTAGVGGAAAMGALGGGFFGSMLGKRPDADLAPGQRPGETLQQTATRLNAQIGALTEQAKEFDADQTRTQAGLMTNTQLIDMYRDQGYGAVKQYQQQLVAQASDPNVPPEQKAAARQAAQQIEDLFKQVSAEEVSRQMPSEVSYKITDTDLTRFDIKGSDPLYKAAFGKDISDPVQVQSILDAIDVELNRKGIRQTQAARLMFFKDALDRVLETLPAGGLYVPPTVQQPSGAGAGVAGVPSVDTTTAGPGAAKPSGVVPPKPDVEQPVSRKAEPTAPITEEAVTPQKPAEAAQEAEQPDAIDEQNRRWEDNKAKVIEVVKNNFNSALDQVGEYGSIDEAFDAYQANAFDTLQEEGFGKDPEWNNLSRLAHETYEKLVAEHKAKQAAPAAPKVAVTPALPNLPKDLALAKPRYAYGEKQFQLKFNSDIDKALYITAQKTPSKRDADYRSWLETQGFTPDQIAQGGQQVREAIKGIAKTAKPEAGPINLPAQIKKPKRSLAPEVEKKLEPIYKDLERRAKAPKQEKPAAEVKEAPKEKTQKDLILEQRAELIKQLDGILKKILAKYNLTGVTLDLDESMADEGSYGAQVIKLALNVDSPVRVLRHESIHALKDMGFFSDAQWKTLVKKAQDEWVDKYLKGREHNATQSRYDAYVELLTKEGKNPTEVQEAIIEEAIADAFGDFDANGATPGLMAAILKRMQNLFKAIKEAFGVAGIDTAEEIFGKIEKGSLKPEIPMGKEQAPKMSLKVIDMTARRAKQLLEEEEAETKEMRNVLADSKRFRDLEDLKDKIYPWLETNMYVADKARRVYEDVTPIVDVLNIDVGDALRRFEEIAENAYYGVNGDTEAYGMPTKTNASVSTREANYLVDTYGKEVSSTLKKYLNAVDDYRFGLNKRSPRQREMADALSKILDENVVSTKAPKMSLRGVPMSTRPIMESSPLFAMNELGLKTEGVKKPGGIFLFNDVRSIANALNRDTVNNYGTIDKEDTSANARNLIAKAIADEVAYQVGTTSQTGTGLGWYSNNYPKAVKKLARKYPELGNNEHARSVFSALVAITSNGEKVSLNIKNAINLYDKLRSGEPMIAPGSRRATALDNNLQMVQDLLEKHGTNFKNVLLQEILVKDMNAALRAMGEKPSGDYLANTKVPAAAVYFGPKLGAFYANLEGAEGYLTMDMWWTRSINRMRGLLMPQATESSINKFREIAGNPNMTRDEVIASTIPLRDRYEELDWTTDLEYIAGEKEPSTKDEKPVWTARAKRKAGPAYEQLKLEHDVMKMANTIYKNEYEMLQEAPFGANDREFMYRAVREAQKMLKQDGVDLTLADIQAALWYYEKRLYQHLSGRKADDIGYDEAISAVAGESDRPARPSVVFDQQPDRGADTGAGVKDTDGVRREPPEAGQVEKKSLRGVVAEVAPNPDIPVAASWRQMTQAERLDATRSVAKKVIDPILSDMGLKGYSFKFSSGKYEGEVNPNILIEAPESATVGELEEVARVVGYILDQKAMVAYDEYNTDSGDQAGFVKVMIPAGMDDKTVTLLRNHISKEVPQADGDTLRDGSLVYGNFSAYNDNVDTLSDEEYHDAIVRAIEDFDYSENIKVSDPLKFHSQLVWPDNRESYLEGTRYGESGTIRGGEGSDVWRQRRSRLEAISEQAIALRDRWIDARGAARIGGRAGDSAAISTKPTAEYGKSIDGSETAVGVHFSQQPRATLDSQFYGAGLRGMERERLEGQPDIRNRIYFYVDTGKGVFPEAGVGGSPHVIRLNNLYNVLKDELDLVKKAKGDTAAERANAWEKAIKNAGFDGYFFPDPLQRQGYAVLIGKHRVETKLSLRSESPEFKFWFGQSKIVDKDGKPKVMYHGTGKDYTVLGTGRRQAKAIFVTDDPEFAQKFAIDTFNRAAFEAAQGVGMSEEAYKSGVARAIAAVKKDYKNLPEGKAMIEDIRKGYARGYPLASPEVNEYMRNAFKDALPAGPNILPIYVKAEYPFDYENKDHVDQVVNLMNSDFDSYGRKLGDKVADVIRRGDWETIETNSVQEAIRYLGFDSFYVKEGGRKSLAVYSPTQITSATGNVGAYGQRPITAEEAGRFGMTEEQAAEAQERGDLRFSLRSKGDPVTRENVVDTMEMAQEKQPYMNCQLCVQMATGVSKLLDLPKVKTAQIGDIYTFNERKNMASHYAVDVGDGNVAEIEGWGEEVRVVPLSEVVDEYDEPSAIRRPPDTAYTGEKFSLRSTLPASAVRAMDKIAPPRYNPGFAERMMNAVSGDTFTSIRQKLINRYEALASVDRRVAKMLKQMGGAPQLAGSRAETAALMSDLGAGVLEAAMGVHNGIGGAPIYRNGVTTVSDYNGTVKGLLEIFKPIAAMKDADAFRMYQTWAAVKRGVRLDAEGREDLITAADIRSINDLRRSNPDLIKTFESVQKDWIAYNNALVKYQVDTGVLSPEMAKEWTKHGDYFPFYRLMEGEDIAGPKVFSSIGNVSRGKKLKGGENPLGDFFENIVRNSQAAIQAGMKNIAAQTATKQALMLQEVTRLTHKPQAHESVYRVYENGREIYYKAHDPLFIEAIKALNMADIPFMGLLAKPAAMLRNLVTKDPAFMLANMMRDSLSAWATSGVKMTPVIDTLRNFGSAIAGKSPELNALYAAGVLGGYDYARGTKQSAEVFEKTLRRRSGQMTPFEVGTKPFTSLWEALEKGTQASDAATRMEVYKRTLAATGNELEALSAALEVMNFNRKGNSAIIRILTAAVPFLNARIQGLDILFRTAIMPFGGSATDQARQRMKTFWVRGMTIMALSSMYWLLTHDDEEYKKQEQETRDNYWLIPSLGVKIPIPFEVGVIFKVVPERLMQLSFGTDTTKDFTDSMKRQFVSTFQFNLMPQVFLPAYEVRTNHSFFTDRPIIGKGLENVADKYQIGPSTSRVAQILGDAANYSPMKIDHLIKGYTGTIGSYASDLLDMMYDMGADSPKASKRFEQMPVIKRFLVDPEARGTVTAYYGLKDQVDQAVRTVNLLERSNNFEEGTKYTLENLRLLATDDYVKDIEKDMKDYREMKQQIMAAPLSADTKRDLLLNINRMESLTTKNIQSIKKFAQ